MKIRIIKEGLFGNPELKIGMEFSLAGHPPGAWAGFYEVVSDDIAKTEAIKANGGKAIVNPAPDPVEAIETVFDADVAAANAPEPISEHAPARRGRPKKDAE